MKARITGKYIALIFVAVYIVISGFWITADIFYHYDRKLEREAEEEWSGITTKTGTQDEFGYGETAIGTSGLYAYVVDREVMDGAGYVSSQYTDHQSGWTVTIMVDSVQNTEYLIFKDKETGNIAAVERRKWEEEVPESEKFYNKDN